MVAFSPLEALTAVCTIFGVYLTIWAYGRTPDGITAFAGPIRARMLLRRRIQLGVYGIVFLVIMGATLTLGTIEGVYPPSLGAIAVAAESILPVLALCWLIWHQASGWIEFHRITMEQPLSIAADGSAYELSSDVRPYIHDLNNVMMLTVGNLSLSMTDGDLEKKAPEILDGMMRAIELQQQIQAIIREPSALIADAGGEGTGQD